MSLQKSRGLETSCSYTVLLAVGRLHSGPSIAVLGGIRGRQVSCNLVTDVGLCEILRVLREWAEKYPGTWMPYRHSHVVEDVWA